MAEIELAARLPLDGFRTNKGGVRAQEVSPGIVSAAAARDAADFAAALRRGWGAERPAVGESRRAGDVRVAALQPEQVWLLHPAPEGALARTRAVLGETAWLVDQSDAWVALELADSGEERRAREALRRLCRLDLDRMSDGAITRTLMEHLGVIVLREEAADAETWTLFSARSSARSLLHAVEAALADAAPRTGH